jgi:hypothetical protein
MNVDESGSYDLAADVHNSLGRRHDQRRHGDYRVAANRDIAPVPRIAASIDNPTILENQIVLLILRVSLD